MNEYRLLRIAVASMAALLVGCHSDSSQSNTSATTQVSTPPIPPNSLFAKIKIGEDRQEVYDTIGLPKTEYAYVPAHAFEPFHYKRGVNWRLARYKGEGSIEFAQTDSFSEAYTVTEIDYDPTETGYAK